MFERYSEKARRTIFFARCEASIWGSPYIETSHLLLALLRENKALFFELIHEHPAIETAAREMGLTPSGTIVSTSVDVPLSHEAKRVLAYSAEEAEVLRHELQLPGHLLLGLLREPNPARDYLEKRGLEPSALREFMRNQKPGAELPPEKRHVTGNIGVHYTPSPNERVVASLREQFERMAARLKPEIEPAVTFLLQTEKQK